MKLKPIYPLLVIFAGILMLMAQSPVTAAPARQEAVASPTPQADGQIIYIVKSGDNCENLSDLYGVSVEYIRTANLLDENCTLREGQRLLIGIGGPSVDAPTPGAAATPTTMQPTATIGEGGTAQVCVLLYNDVNGDGLRQETELGVADGAISLTSSSGQYSQTQGTISAIDPDTEDAARTCFKDLQPGAYTVSSAVPDGFNATTALSYAVDTVPGDTSVVDFGAQPNTAAEAQNPSKSSSPLLGIIGALFLLGGIGLGIYTWRTLRKK